MNAFGILLWHAQRLLRGPLQMTPNDEVKSRMKIERAGERLRIQTELRTRIAELEKGIAELRAIVDSIHRRVAE